MPVEIDGTMMGGVGGCTYPWGDELKERGFQYQRDLRIWAAPIEKVDNDDLQALFKEYGFPVTLYDAAEVESDGEGEEGGQ